MSDIDLVHASVAAQVYVQMVGVAGHKKALAASIEKADAFVAGYREEIALRGLAVDLAEKALARMPVPDAPDSRCGEPGCGGCAQDEPTPPPKRGPGRPKKGAA